MAIVEVKVPQLSESVAEATLLQWKKKPGEYVDIDEIIIEIETDKVVLEVPAPAAGVLLAPAGLASPLQQPSPDAAAAALACGVAHLLLLPLLVLLH